MNEPRAVRIDVSHLPHVTTELWMGGAGSPSGEPLLPQDLAGAWVIDCSGDMPEHYRAAAAWWVTNAINDYEELPPSWERLSAMAESVGRCLARSSEIQAGAEHPAQPPPRLYVFCHQGMNRSGLFMGLILRALGLAGEEAIRTITAHRPDALRNATFVRLIRDE